MEGSDICFAPILTMQEAPKHPHNQARQVFIERHGVTQPAPAPRFSRTPSAARDPAAAGIGALVGGGKKGNCCRPAKEKREPRPIITGRSYFLRLQPQRLPPYALDRF